MVVVVVVVVIVVVVVVAIVVVDMMLFCCSTGLFLSEFKSVQYLTWSPPGLKQKCCPILF